METDLEKDDRVYLISEPASLGTIAEVEDNGLSVMVMWDDCAVLDFQWANKVARTA